MMSADRFVLSLVNGDKWRKFRKRYALIHTPQNTIRNTSTNPYNQMGSNNLVILHISFLTRSLGRVTSSTDNAVIVPHQLAPGVTLCDVISAIDLWG